MSHARVNQFGWPRWVMWMIALLPPIVWGALLWYSQANEAGFMALTEEDHLVENSQALLYFLGAILSACVAWRLRRMRRWGWALLYVALALGLIVVTGEEISWGQRVFHFQTPGWLASRNMQEEINLHNLPEVRKVTDYWFDRILFMVMVLSGLGWLLRGRWPVRWRTELWVPHVVLLPAWLCAWSYDRLRDWYLWHYQARQVSYVVHRLHEGRELVFAFAIAAFLMMVLRQLQRSGEPVSRHR